MDRQNRKIEREYEAGYRIVSEDWRPNEECPWVNIRSAETLDGLCIGKSRWAHWLIVKHGIKPEYRTDTSNVCSIGFSEREQKWYGWSHRAFYGFAIGDVVKDGDCTASTGWTDEYLADHPEANTALPVGFEAHTLDDCKRMAVAFAASVS